MIVTIGRNLPGEGTWESIEARWTLARYDALLDHLRHVGPPVYESLGVLMKWEPATRAAGDDVLTDPQEIGRLFEAMMRGGAPAGPGG